ncbi:Ig-like domain-containing protein [Aquiflexum sp.]|uniref:Ig-like domain-containing protein n=1 Tax=Aquiflexum sp. TaxID=1872584 RepID=UPI0035945E14
MKTELTKKRLWRTFLVAFSITAIFGSCHDDFNETLGICPEVEATNPIDEATGVEMNRVIAVTFNGKLNPATITDQSFSLRVINTSGAIESSVSGSLTYDDTNNTMSFVPNAPLAPKTTYTGKVEPVVKDLMGNALQSPYVWTFTTGESPTVTATDPANLSTGISLDKAINAKFSAKMDPLTIKASSFTIKNGTTAISGEVTYVDSTATFTPSIDLLPGTTYTGTISVEAVNTDGIPLANEYSWTFNTTAVPTVLSVDPADMETGVIGTKVVRAVFSEAMDPVTVTGATFTLKQGNTTVAGKVTYSGTTASFTPNNPLLPNLVYTATITTGAKSTSGISLAANYVWSFTTAPSVAPTVVSTDPHNNETNVGLNKVVNATFSEAMNPATITAMTFTLKQGANAVNGAVTYNGTTASFTPNNPLSPNLTYTGTITTGAQNLTGTALANDYIWTFQTATQQSAYFVDLKTAGRFGIFAATGISNNAGFSEIRNLDVGITPGARSSVTGFPPAIIVNGAIYAADDINPAGVAAMLIQAKSDLTAAYLFAEGATSPAPVSVAGDQGGKTLAPGIYKSNSTLLIQGGDLTLDAKGDPNAVWIFQIASGFTTVGGAGGNVILSGGAKAENIFWQVGSSATIGDNTAFHGNVLALTSITMNSNATVVGRMLVINGAVVMTNTNIIEKP